MANDHLKIVVEQNVPFLECLDSVADVCRLPYSQITASSVADADALVVRTRNRCDAALLDGSNVKLIATATIGMDHIDLPWCAAHDIKVVNAPGSNAPAVAQYVFSSLMRVINRPISLYCIGIVGVGHVGSIVARVARSLGMKVMLCDPPRSHMEPEEEWYTLQRLATVADIITFHTPLTDQGPDATYHLADADFFNSLRRAPIIINSARGAVVDNAAWADAIDAGVCGPAIVDCWEGEPNINLRLLNAAAIATPHIAGYSIEGKQRASMMVVEAISRNFNLGALTLASTCASSLSAPRHWKAIDAYRGFDPLPLTEALKADPDKFEQLRNSYPLRPEYGKTD